MFSYTKNISILPLFFRISSTFNLLIRGVLQPTDANILLKTQGSSDREYGEQDQNVENLKKKKKKDSLSNRQSAFKFIKPDLASGPVSLVLH